MCRNSNFLNASSNPSFPKRTRHSTSSRGRLDMPLRFGRETPVCVHDPSARAGPTAALRSTSETQTLGEQRVLTNHLTESISLLPRATLAPPQARGAHDTASAEFKTSPYCCRAPLGGHQDREAQKPSPLDCIPRRAATLARSRIPQKPFVIEDQDKRSRGLDAKDFPGFAGGSHSGGGFAASRHAARVSLGVWVPKRSNGNGCGSVSNGSPMRDRREPCTDARVERNGFSATAASRRPRRP